MSARAARALLLALATTAIALAGLADSASAAEAVPAWKVAAATGPTNLPPVQSEVQQLTVEGEEGTFTLSQPVTGEAHRSRAQALLTFVAGSKVATYGGESNPFEVGQEVIRSTVNRLPVGAKVVAAETGGGEGSTVEFDTLPNSVGGSNITAVSKVLGDVEGTFYGGETVTGEGIPASTTITAVDPAAHTLTISNNPTVGGTFPLNTVRTTAPLPYDASAQEVQAALEGLPGFGPGSITVSGGPGGDVARPFVIGYRGGHANEDVPQLAPDGSALGGEKHYATVATIVPGGPGTGEIVVYPTNVGGKNTNGQITVTVGPLPSGFAVAGAAGGKGWTCTNTATEASCESNELALAGAVMQPFGVPVEVGPLATPTAAVGVAISGGGAVEATTSASIRVSPEAAPFGIAALWSGAFEADGRPSTQAGGHPYSDMTWFMVNTDRSRSGQIVPAGDVKDVNADLPAGFVGNPLVTAERCPLGVLVGAPGTICESGAGVGILRPNITALGLGGEFLPGNPQLFNDVPAVGSAAEFSGKFGSPYVSLFGSLRSSEDFGIRVSAPHVPSTVAKSFVTFVKFFGLPESAGGKAFFRNATDCSEQAREAPSVGIEANSWQVPTFGAAGDRQQPVTGCDKLRFAPEFSFQPTSTQGSSGVGATAHLHIDQSGLSDPNKLATPDLKQSVVTLPVGFTVNPSQANGLEACSEAQVGYMPGAAPIALNPTRFDEDPVTCPDGSKLGTVEATTPLLEEPLQGTIYLARQDENPFHTLIALYLVFESPRFGVTLKLPGKAALNPSNGQITATFDYVPQQPVEDLTLHFRGGGPRSEFATPEVCGTYSTTGTWTPWSAPESGPPAQTSDGFTVSSGCSSSAATRPFHPSFEAGTADPIAGAFTPLVININRNDGEGELKNVDFTLPPGISAKLAGVPYCPEAGIATAASKSGRQEQAAPSCPAASQIGTVDVGAGVGSQPFHTGGRVYLAGPYKGAPLSAVVITPAVAGPFDLGNVVVRSPLDVNLETAQVTAESDPIPTILQGVPLKVRSVSIDIDRPGFSLNPTNCELMSAAAKLGSSNGAIATPSNRFQVGGCKNLGYKPHLKLSLKGATKRAGHPALRAVLTAPQGAYANTARIQVGLPPSEFLDQGNLNKVCTQPELKSRTCPAKSVYGHVKVWTPLFEKPLQGNVYIGVGYGHKLPDLVTELNGQVRLLVHGRVDTTKQHGLRNTFEVVPDAPFSRVVLEMKGGKKYGLFENSENLCRKKQLASAKFVAQNGLAVHLRPRIANRCGKGKMGKKHAKHRTQGKKD
ncbi:MAG TPA: hypothetical protein VHE08_06420 [Solirubrobacterales bacterium]|nr:hypothetical protein [Solirubrobacterales bacterium]